MQKLSDLGNLVDQLQQRFKINILIIVNSFKIIKFIFCLILSFINVDSQLLCDFAQFFPIVIFCVTTLLGFCFFISNFYFIELPFSALHSKPLPVFKLDLFCKSARQLMRLLLAVPHPPLPPVRSQHPVLPLPLTPLLERFLPPLHFEFEPLLQLVYQFYHLSAFKARALFYSGDPLEAVLHFVLVQHVVASQFPGGAVLLRPRVSAVGGGELPPGQQSRAKFLAGEEVGECFFGGELAGLLSEESALAVDVSRVSSFHPFIAISVFGFYGV